MSQEDLKPCPFCGGIAFRADVPTDTEDENAGGSYIQCKDCAASTALHFEFKENLASSWNNRSDIVSDREYQLEGAVRALNEVLVKAQQITTQTLVGKPHGLSDKDGLSALIGLLDGPEQRSAQKLARLALSPPTNETEHDLHNP